MSDLQHIGCGGEILMNAPTDISHTWEPYCNKCGLVPSSEEVERKPDDEVLPPIAPVAEEEPDPQSPLWLFRYHSLNLKRAITIEVFARSPRSAESIRDAEVKKLYTKTPITWVSESIAIIEGLAHASRNKE